MFAEELVEYFSTDYVNGTFRRVQTTGEYGAISIRMHHSKPRFPQALGNVHAATMNNEPRTNKQCEGYNNRFACLIGHTHPDIWKFIDTIKCEVCYVSAVIRMNDCIKICTDPVERSWPDTTRNCRLQSWRNLHASCFFFRHRFLFSENLQRRLCIRTEHENTSESNVKCVENA